MCLHTSVLFLLAATTAARAQPQYDLHLLPTLGGPDSRALAINNHAVIVGDSKIPGNNYAVATAWINLEPIFIGGSGGSVAQACAINDAGVAVGIIDDPPAAFVMPLPSGPPQTPPALADRLSSATTINAGSDIAGGWSTVIQQGIHPYIIRQGILTDLPVLGGSQGLVTSISNTGHIVGWSEFTDTTGQPAAVRWVEGIPERLPDLGGYAVAADVNDGGIMVGSVAAPGLGPSTAVLWSAAAELTPLGSLDPAHWRHEAMAINSQGQVVGTSGNRAFLWQDGMMRDLNTLTAAPGVLLVEARDISDTGLIVGVALVGNNTRGFLLVPRCCSDFDHDSDAGTDQDIEAFFACLAGNCCASCGNADFNGDGDTGTDADIEAFFRVLAGGSC